MTTEQLRDAFRQFSRNFCWGDCADCPTDSLGYKYPEFCEYKDRYDHKLSIQALVRAYKASLELANRGLS